MTAWRECLIDDVFDVARGGSPRPIDKYITNEPDGINWIMIGDTSDKSKYISKTKKKILPSGRKKSRMVYPGDFLLTNSMSFGRPYINQIEGCIHDGWLVLSPRDKAAIHADFFYYLLGSPEFKRVFEKQAAGAVVKNLNSEIVKKTKIRLPENVKEQRRIAQILDKADSVRRKRALALSFSDELISAAFLETFGDPALNSRGWRLGTIDECLSGAVGGWSANGESRPATNTEMGVLKISAVTSGEYIPSENKAVREIPANRSLIVPKAGDLLFSRANTRELVAATCVVMEAPQNVFLPDKLWRLDIRPDVAEATYLKCVLSHPEYRQLLCSRATGTSGSMLNISKAKLLEHPIPIPPIEFQRAFAKRWHRVKMLVAKQKLEIKEAEILFSALSQRAFVGEL